MANKVPRVEILNRLLAWLGFGWFIESRGGYDDHNIPIGWVKNKYTGERKLCRLEDDGGW